MPLTNTESDNPPTFTTPAPAEEPSVTTEPIKDDVPLDVMVLLTAVSEFDCAADVIFIEVAAPLIVALTVRLSVFTLPD
jgi:hypothetical protein